MAKGQHSLEVLFITMIIVLFSVMIMNHYFETKDSVTALTLLKSDLTKRMADYNGQEFVRINTILLSEKERSIDFNVYTSPTSIVKTDLYPGGDNNLRELIDKHTTYLKDNISITFNP